MICNLPIFPKHILHGRFCLPEVVQIDISFRVQNFKAPQLDHIALPAASGHTDSAGHILAEINDRLSFRSDKYFFCRNPVDDRYSCSSLRMEDGRVERNDLRPVPGLRVFAAPCFTRPVLSRLFTAAPSRDLQGGVIRFSVVYLRKYNRCIRTLPVLSGTDHLFPAIIVS